MKDYLTLDLFHGMSPDKLAGGAYPEPDGSVAPEEEGAENLPRSRVRRDIEDDSQHKRRRRSVTLRQREQVFQVLRGAYPHPVSHATICKKVKTNRASHRIRELIQDGWVIEGAGTLGLDAGSQTQLYRLARLERGEPQTKYLGLKVLWDQDGLKVTLHQDVDPSMDARTLSRLARRVERVVREELEGRIRERSPIRRAAGAR